MKVVEMLVGLNALCGIALAAEGFGLTHFREWVRSRNGKGQKE
jgi:hypothetical protein